MKQRLSNKVYTCPVHLKGSVPALDIVVESLDLLAMLVDNRAHNVTDGDHGVHLVVVHDRDVTNPMLCKRRDWIIGYSSKPDFLGRSILALPGTTVPAKNQATNSYFIVDRLRNRRT